MIIVGIDPSLTGLGFCVLGGGEGTLFEQSFSTPASMPMLKRLTSLSERVAYHVKYYNPDLVVIEGLVNDRFGSGNDRAGLHWLIRASLSKFEEEGRLKVVFPTSLKKWVCGTGSAQKELMLMKTLKRWGREYTDNNLCDAYCLAKWGEAYLAGEVSLPAPKAKKAKKGMGIA